MPPLPGMKSHAVHEKGGGQGHATPAAHDAATPTFCHRYSCCPGTHDEVTQPYSPVACYS